MSKKLIGIIASFALVLSMVGGSVAQAAALTSAQVSAIVSLLQSFGADATTVANVTASLNGQPTSGTVTTTGSATSGYTFATDLTVGSKGADVTALQNLLGISPATGYFGSLTKAALIKYQLEKGITPAAGYFGSKTRATVNGSVTTTTTTTTTTTGTNVTGVDLKVSLAPTSPVAGALLSSQAAANLAEYTFENTSAVPAVVTNVTLSKIGVAGDSTLNAVYLYEGAVRLTDSASVSSGKVMFNAGTGLFTVPAGSSRTISVRADIVSGLTSSELVGVSLTNVLTNVPVQALYPVSGAMMTVYSPTASELAAVTIAAAASSTPATAVNVQAGTLNYTIWSAPMVVSNKAAYLTRAAFKVVGSIPMDSLTNLKLYVGGVQVATAAGIDTNGYMTFDLGAYSYKIETGSKNLEVRADVIKGSTRDFTVSIQNAADIGLICSNYNVGVTPNISGKPVTTAKMTVSQGDITFQDDASLISGNIVTGSSQAVIGKWTMKAYGEDMKISSFLVKTSTTTKSVSLFANGMQIGSTQDNLGVDKTYTVNYTIPAGTSVSLELKADMKNLVGNIAVNTVVTGTLTASSLNTQGLYSFATRNIPASAKTGPQMTVVGAGMTVTKSVSDGDSVLLPSSSKNLIGSFVVKADSSEIAIIRSITVNLGGTIATTDLSNLTVEISGVGASTPVNPQSVNNITLPNGNFEIAADSSRTVKVYADVNNISSGTATTSIQVIGNGKFSNIDLDQSATGQTMSVTSGTLANIALSSVSPATKFVVGNTTGNAAGTFTLKAVSAPVEIKKVSVKLTVSTSTAISSITFGGKTVDITEANATTTLDFTSAPILVQNNLAGTAFPVVVSYRKVGTTTNSGVESNLPVGVQVVSIEYKSGNTSTTTYPTSANATNNMYVVAGMPTVTLVTPGTGAINNKLVARMNISSTGSLVRLTQIPLTFAVVGNSSGIASGTVVNIKNSAGTTVATGITAGSAITSQTVTAVFSGTYDVTGETLDVYADGLSLSGTTDVNKVTTGLGVATSFQWVDVEGDLTAITSSANLSTSQYNVNLSVVVTD